jgi:hypothetical protein
MYLPTLQASRLIERPSISNFSFIPGIGKRDVTSDSRGKNIDDDNKDHLMDDGDHFDHNYRCKSQGSGKSQCSLLESCNKYTGNCEMDIGGVVGISFSVLIFVVFACVCCVFCCPFLCCVGLVCS